MALWRQRLLLCVNCIFCFLLVDGQRELLFPTLFNVAKGKPVYAQPGQSSCSRLYFCRSTPLPTSIPSCTNADFCDSSCPTRSFMPKSFQVLEHVMLDKCVFQDFSFVPENSSAKYSVFFSLEDELTNCSLSTAGSVFQESISGSSFFTIALWFTTDFTKKM